ncbi:unnamed protein product [Microthlaspi erraticum]|uniref:DUF3444 domain-containing protein n=1 Tax=Microthlaspi erraticum TaxID=1685480 RepID=A0A6D2JMI4_9BRAS|nr:unnamed protein product [Microthlaspi erraticum]
MEPDCSLPSRVDSPELEPAPAETEHHCQDRVSATDEIVIEDDLVGSGQIKLGITEILAQIHKKASSVLKSSLQCEEIGLEKRKRNGSASPPTSEHRDEGETDEDVSEVPEEIVCVDSEFNEFKNTMSSFKVNKVWALYDPLDGMPRLYCKIKKIAKSGSSFQVTCLDSKDEESVPVSCGRFEYGITETIRSQLVFSHEMKPNIYGRNISVIPRKGETWALFRDWKRSQLYKHKPPYRYDFVEILFSDKEQGVGVKFLGKVRGFTSVFNYAEQHVIAEMIGTEEMGRFSHRVPSFRLTGDEKNGVPANSFELDPAAVPSCMLGEEAVETETQSVEVGSRKDVPVVILD